MKLSIFYFVYACFLIVTWHAGYRKEILCFYGSYFGMFMVYVHHFFVCAMAGHFGMKIYKEHRINRIIKKHKEEYEIMKKKSNINYDDFKNNYFKNN